MGKKKEKEIDLNNLKPEEELKYEIAKELGYLDKVMATGWKSLTAKESGRIGGIMTRKKREEQMNRELQNSDEKDAQIL
jgi:hypothetical protein